MALANGCTEGENIPLSPPFSGCEVPLDHKWYDLNNVFEGHQPADCLWLDEKNAVVVCTDGFILETDGVGQWVSKETSVSGDFTVVVANEDQNLVAAGLDGALALRLGGTWQVDNSVPEQNWYSASADGGTVWLAGSGGSLLHAVPGQDWSLNQHPVIENLLSVCAFEDSVFVGGPEGQLSVLVNDQWTDVSPPALAEKPIKSLVKLNDGRLAALAEKVWVRQADQWEVLYDDTHSSYRSPHLKYRDGILWIQDRNLLGMEIPGDEALFYRSDHSGGYMKVGAPGPDKQVLLFSSPGGATWHLGSGLQNRIIKVDPAGAISHMPAVKLHDGTVVVTTYNGIFEVTSSGLRRIETLALETELLMDELFYIGGHSLSDFYMTDSRILYRVIGGQTVLQEDIPENGESIYGIVVAPSGTVYMNQYERILIWENNSWTEIFTAEPDNISRLDLTAGNTLVWQGSWDSYYLSENGAIPVGLSSWSLITVERKPGILEYFCRGHQRYYLWWQKGTGATGESYLNPLPGCEQIGFGAACDHEGGVYLSTLDHSMVLKVPDDFSHNNWELVAGPNLNQISQMEMLVDGTLVVQTSSNFFQGYPTR